MRSIYHVNRFVRSGRISAADRLNEILRIVEQCEFPGITSEDRFRVTSKRTGTHPFRSTDIERESGSVVERTTGMSVDLERFTVHVRVDLYDRYCVVSVQRTAAGLDRRYQWDFRPRVALRTVVAYAMLRLARLPVHTGAILDPFCGSGTILLEAAACFPNARIAGCDKVSECAEGARANMRRNGAEARVEVFNCDARDLCDHFERASFDAVVCNPPFGVRLGLRTDFRRLYDRFLRGAATVIRPGGRIVFLGGKRRHHIAHLLHGIPELHMNHVRVIETGGVYPALYVLERV